MDHNKRLLDVALYAIFVGIVGILEQTILQLMESTAENKMCIGISLVILVMNFIAALWVFSKIDGDMEHTHWKFFESVLIFTGILSPYVAFCVLLPQGISWPGFAIICIVMTFSKGFNMAQSLFTWFYQTTVTATKYLTEKFSVLILRCELSIDAAV